MKQEEFEAENMGAGGWGRDGGRSVIIIIIIMALVITRAANTTVLC